MAVRVPVLASLATLVATQGGGGCNPYQDFPDYGVTYDLTSFAGTGRPITMSDNRNNSAAVFNYVMGVCTDLDPTDPSYSMQLAGCASTSNDDGSGVKTGPGPAFQVQVGSTPPICKRLGDAAANGQFYIDVDNRNPQRRSRAAQGINLVYTNGDSCVSLVNSSQLQPRAITLSFQCSDQPIITDKGVVLENAYCGYFAIIPTRYACPTQCARRNGRVCGANGICDYDVAGGYAKCFCNKGFSGADCSVPGDKGLPPPISYAPNLAGGFFGGLVGGMTLALGAFIVKAVGAATSEPMFTGADGGALYTPPTGDSIYDSQNVA